MPTSSERKLDQLAVERLINRMRTQTRQHKGTTAITNGLGRDNQAKDNDIASYYQVLLQPYF